jgi:hypothetical protein
MRFGLRTLLIAVAFVAAFLGGRASVMPLIKEHERQAKLLEQQLKSQEQLRPRLASMQENLILLMTQGRRQDKAVDQVIERFDRALQKARARNDELLNGQLLFPVNIERAMLGEGKEMP